MSLLLGTELSVTDRALCDTPLWLTNNSLSLSSVFWNTGSDIFKHNIRKVSPERLNVTAFLRECFAVLTCLSEILSIWEVNENCIIALVKNTFAHIVKLQSKIFNYIQVPYRIFYWCVCAPLQILEMYYLWGLCILLSIVICNSQICLMIVFQKCVWSEIWRKRNSLASIPFPGCIKMLVGSINWINCWC